MCKVESENAFFFFNMLELSAGAEERACKGH